MAPLFGKKRHWLVFVSVIGTKLQFIEYKYHALDGLGEIEITTENAVIVPPL